MTVFMGTTQVPAEKSISQIQSVLAANGARRIMLDYADGRPSGLAFQIPSENGSPPWSFNLPVRVEAVFCRIQTGRRYASIRERNAERDREDAYRIAWRQLFRWIEAQMALVDTGMVTAREVFVPYLYLHGGQTLYERIESLGTKALPLLNEEPRL